MLCVCVDGWGGGGGGGEGAVGTWYCVTELHNTPTPTLTLPLSGMVLGRGLYWVVGSGSVTTVNRHFTVAVDLCMYVRVCSYDDWYAQNFDELINELIACSQDL